MRRTIILSGLAIAAAAFLLDQLEYRYAMRAYATETYIIMIGFLFAGLGLWTGLRLARTETSAPFEPNKEAIAYLGVSDREIEVLLHLADGQTNKEIARSLGVSPNTIKTHLSNLYEKLGVQRRTQAIQKAKSLRLIP